MFRLTKAEIRMILERLELETVVEPNNNFPFAVVTRARGYSRDVKIGKLQAKLSIMLEAAPEDGQASKG